MYIIIPARKNSKGLPHKNRILCNRTFAEIPHNLRKNVIVSTDDSSIKDIALDFGFKVIDRPEEIANDHSSIKDVILHAIEETGMAYHERILMLYLTYPDRNWSLIENAIEHFDKKKPMSMLCRMKPITHPYLCIDEDGKKIIDHDLYRRQDYPEVYEMSHCIFISYSGEIKNLDNNLYNEETEFFHIPRMRDVDTIEDLL
jgi:CMP-N-acetylneuraminic acid synthetase